MHVRLIQAKRHGRQADTFKKHYTYYILFNLILAQAKDIEYNEYTHSNRNVKNRQIYENEHHTYTYTLIHSRKTQEENFICVYEGECEKE